MYIGEIYLDDNTLTTIESLDLINKGLTELPKEINRLTNLKALYITENDITYLPDEIMQLSNLREFYFINNHNLVLTSEQKDWIDTLNVGDSMIHYVEGEHEKYLTRRLEIIKLALMLGDGELIKSQREKTMSFRVPDIINLLSTIEQNFTTYPSQENDNLVSLVNRYLHKIGDDDYFHAQMDEAEAVRCNIHQNN